LFRLILVFAVAGVANEKIADVDLRRALATGATRRKSAGVFFLLHSLSVPGKCDYSAVRRLAPPPLALCEILLRVRGRKSFEFLVFESDFDFWEVSFVFFLKFLTNFCRYFLFFNLKLS